MTQRFKILFGWRANGSPPHDTSIETDVLDFSTPHDSFYAALDKEPNKKHFSYGAIFDRATGEVYRF